MEGNSIKTFENLCKIFEMRIKLDNAKGEKTPLDVSENYEKYAKKIDTFYNDVFQKELKKLISPESTLENERRRLEKLISLLEDRLSKRSALVGEYHHTTGKYIKGLQLIVSESELNNKKERLSLITKYLDTTKEIEDIKASITKLEDELEEEKNKKEEYFDNNKILEDDLYSVFVTDISNDDYYSDIEEEKISEILSEVSKKASENKETLDITKESIASLLSSGMDDEYESYVEEASKSYSLWKDREIILKIYKLVINFEDEFDDLLKKRSLINNLLDERKSILMNKEDILVSFENLMIEQSRTLDSEKGILDNIANYTSRIEFKEDRLDELENVIMEPEILVILKEYNLYDDGRSNTDVENKEDEVLTNTESLVVKEYNPYRIVSIGDAPVTLNVNLAKLKGASVRDKVNKKLNPELVVAEEVNNVLTTEKMSSIPVTEESIVEVPTTTDNIPEFQVIGETENKKNASVKADEPLLNVSDEVINPINDNEVKDLSEVLPELNNGNNVVKDNEETSDNSFWVPVSDSKLETSEFPNINIPIVNNSLNNGDDNFGFPEA